MREDPLQFVSKSLHARFDRITEEPLPKRWVELIHYLNEIEHRRTQMLVKPGQTDGGDEHGVDEEADEMKTAAR